MKKFNSISFKELLVKSNSISKISPNLGEWFFTLDLYTTEFSTGIGFDNTKAYKQTWELESLFIDQSDGLTYFMFTMWGDEPSFHNQYFNSLHHEGKTLFVLAGAVIELLKWQCIMKFVDSNDTDFELKNLRNCQGLKPFFITNVPFETAYINNISAFNGQRILVELNLPTYFQFPENTLINNFTRAMKIKEDSNEGEIVLKKTLAGNLTATSNKISIDNNSNEFLPNYESEKDFILTITQSKGCIQVSFFDKNRNNVFELPMDSFHLIPPFQKA